MLHINTSLEISISVLIFLTYCVSSDSFSFHYQRLHNSYLHGHVASSGCCSCPQNDPRFLCYREDLVRKYHSSSLRSLNRISAAKLLRMSSTPNCHPDDDPNSGSVLPVKDRIALYSQVSIFASLKILCCNILQRNFSCSVRMLGVVYT
jgi:hypothetical protein